MQEEIIQIQSLSKYFGKNVGIENVSFSVNKGEVFGFIGPNGAGKSTTIRVLLNLLFPSSGSASIFGFDVVKEAIKIKPRIGYLPSEVNYYEKMTVSELLDYSADLYGVKDISSRNQLCERFSLDTSRELTNLSMGNKKKVAIVQAFMHKPELIIMDEPTNGLDPLMQNSFFDLLKEVNQNGTTMLMSSHILSDIQRMCDRVAIIRKGKVVATEDITSLLSKQLKSCSIVLKDEANTFPISIDGVSDISGSAKRFSFTYKGDVQLLMNSLNKLDLLDVNIEEPGLEEIFMHYYK